MFVPPDGRPAMSESNTACGLTTLYMGDDGELHEMLRECWNGRPSPYESCVDRPTCSDGMNVLAGDAAII
jgi:hypothetical protein